MPNGDNEQQSLYERLGLGLFEEDIPEPLILPEEPKEEEKPGEDESLFERLGLQEFEPTRLTPTEEYNKVLEAGHVLPDDYKETSGLQGYFNDKTLTRDVYVSEWQAITKSAQEGEGWAIKQREAILEDMRRKAQFGEGAQYISKRLLSIVPFVELDWKKHRLTPLQFAAAADPTSPEDIYSPVIRGFAVPGGEGLRIGIQDVADLMSTIGEFSIIGGATAVPFKAAMMAKKTGKLASGVHRIMAKSPKMKRIATNVSKANIDFQLFNMATVHPEDTQEGAELKDKLMARVKNIPSTMITASLFGSLGSFENVYGQYGGVFTAGYTSTIVEALKEGINPAQAHADAMKSGFMLVGAHAFNVLGTKGGEFFKEYGKGKGLKESTIEWMANHIVQKRIPEKEVWHSKNKELPHVQIVGEKKIRGKDSFLLQDIGNETAKPVPMEKGEFYASYDKSSYFKDGKSIRNHRLRKVHGLQRELKMDDEATHKFKRKIYGQKGPTPEVKPGEIPAYVDLKSKTMGELQGIAEKYGIDYSRAKVKIDLIELIEKSVPKSAGEYLSWRDATPEQLYKAYEKLDHKLQVQEVKKDIELGLHSELIDKDGNKVYLKRTIFNKEPIATVTNMERIIQAFTGEKKHGDLIGEKMSQQINEVVYKHNLKEENFVRIARAKFGRMDIRDLSKGEQQVLDIYTKQMEQGAVFAMEEGIFDLVVENYMTGLYPKIDGSTITRTLGRTARITGETQYSKKKLFSSPIEAAEAGLEPVYDMRRLVGEWWTATHKAVAQKRLAQRLQDLPVINGDPAISAERVPGYLAIKDMPVLSKIVTNSRNKPVYVHPELTTQFKLLMKRGMPAAGWKKAYQTLSNSVKRIIMINPLIHGWNIYSDVMDEYNFRLLKAGRVLLFGEKQWLLLKRAGLVKGKKEFKKLTSEEQRNLMDRLESEMTASGSIDLATTTSITSELQKGVMNRNFSELTPSEATLKQRFQQLGGRVSGANSTWGKTKVIGRSMRLAADRILWDKWVRNSQVAIYSMLKGRALKHGLSSESAKRTAGHYTKDLLGMLDKEIFGPTSGEVLSYALFARNWTVSNLRLVSGAIGYRGSKLPRFLAHKGLNQGEMKFLQEQYASHLIKGVVGMTVLTNLLNYFITGTESSKDEKGNFKGFKFNKENAKWSTSNERGHEMDLDSGMLDKKNRKIYVTPPTFRYIRDYFGWFGEPSRTFFNKMHPVPKSFMEIALNMSLWNRKQIVTYPEQKTQLKQWSERTLHLLHAVTPYGQFAGRPDEVRNLAEKIVPWFGTWIRHGVGGGDFAMDINTLYREKGYKEDEIDKQIDLMAQGDPIGVLQTLVESGRYRTADGIKRRLMKYQNPLLYKFLLLSRIDQAELLSRYTPIERERFFKALKAGGSKIKIDMNP